LKGILLLDDTDGDDDLEGDPMEDGDEEGHDLEWDLAESGIGDGDGLMEQIGHSVCGLCPVE
jgi:hypothetical protein